MSNSSYGGFWFNEDENTATFCVLTSATSGAYDLYYPTLYKIDLLTNVKVQIFPYDDIDLSTLIIPTTIDIDSYDRPVFSFNFETKVYHVMFLTRSNLGAVQLHSIDLIEIDKYRCNLVTT